MPEALAKLDSHIMEQVCNRVMDRGANAAFGHSIPIVDMYAGPEGEMPEALAKLDSKIVEQVCNEVMDSRPTWHLVNAFTC